ncbi:MAG: hypothetical protein AAB403_06415 [Planctomycetota bacterium]
MHAKCAFTVQPTLDGSGTIVVSHETQVGPLPWFDCRVLAPRLYAANQAMVADLARASPRVANHEAASERAATHAARAA